MSTLLSVFFGILLLSFTIAYYLTRPRTAKKSIVKRLNVIHRPPNSADIDLIELSQDKRGRMEELSAALERFRFSRHVAKVILYAGREDSVGKILLISAAIAMGAALACHFLGGPLVLMALAAAVGAMLPYVWLLMKKGKRLGQFNQALPDAIELMARALRAGHSSGSAIEIIAEQSPQPLAGEFAHCFQQQKFGIPFRDALLELAERVPSNDLHFLVTAILVQKETGGDLIQILERTMTVIRERVRIEGEVKSYTAQGRLTGWILAAMPLVMLGLINVFSPGYTHVLFVDPLGIKLLYAGVVLIAIGAATIRKIVDVKV